MQPKNPLMKKIKENLKVPLVLGLLQLLIIQGCTSGSVKRQSEVWLIDSKEGVLYRVISDTKEKVFPIKGNKEAEKMMCIHQDHFVDIVEELD